MVTSISEMRAKNKEAGQFFFAKGNAPIVARSGDYVITRGFGGGFVIYKYRPSDGHFNLVDNQSPSAEYSWDPFKTKAQAVAYARNL